MKVAEGRDKPGPPTTPGEERRLPGSLPRALCAPEIQLSPSCRAPCPRRAHISGPPAPRITSGTAAPAEPRAAPARSVAVPPQ
ncbi:hypothetical protein GH733_002662 [Mirounga leonina]|nr:hypothetical protein GH733_002662 [Mirounga leonina]